nr:hypothetical protein [Tanacetum cinerariifolium]
MQTQTSNTLHNAIMEASSKDRPSMLAPGNYIQWKSRIKRYINTKPNHELIHYCLTNPPYELGWKEKFVLDSEGNPTTATKKVFETYKSVTQEIRDQLNAEAEAVQIILTGIDNDIYSIVDACPNACEMWKAIERLKQGIDNDIYSTIDACQNACEMWKAIERLEQGESINVQDLETNLYWKFRKFTSQDGETLESYYSRFYKMMNELIRNQCKSQELKTVSYHKLYDILKQHQHEVNEIRAEKIARVANILTLVAQQQLVYHPQTHPTHYTQNSSTRSQQAATKNRGKATVNTPQPIYDQESSMVDEDDNTSKDKEIDKLMALISLSFKKIYKPTNNNLRTSSNTSRANQDNSPWINRNVGYENQWIGNVAGARETVGSTVVRKSGIQCYNCKEFGHVARECQKLKRLKDAAYHREKMLLCKQEEVGIQLNAEQADWRDDTDDDELEDQELEARYMYMAQLQQMELECAKVRGDLLSYKMDYQKSSTKYNDTINALNQTISELKDKLSAHQETISILSKQKEAQIKLYKTKEDKELDKVIELENKVKVLDNIVYKTDQSVQTMNKLNNKCQTSFAKPEFLKKAQRANPRLYDIGCYNDNLALMLTPNSDEDNSPKIHRNAGYESQRSGNVAGARETVGSSMVQKSGIQCYNYKEFRHVARECQKPKRAKDTAYHREKMLLCKQEKAGIQLNAEQADWKDDTDDEFNDQELEASTS